MIPYFKAFGRKQPDNTPSAALSSDDDDDDDLLVERNENDTVTPDEMDALLAKEMSKLSVNDRDKLVHDIHGISNNADRIELDGEKLNEKLNELSNALHKEIQRRPDAALSIAVKRNRDYVFNKDNLTWYLFGETGLKISTCVQRMFLHFEKKRELFGEETLARNITQDDLNDGDLEALASGFFMHLPCVDRAGRTIIMCNPALKPKNKDPIHLVRMVYYLSSRAVFGIESQRNGCVIIIYDVDRNDVDIRDPSVPKLGNLVVAVPAHVVGMHICFDQPHIKCLISVILLFVRKELRLRTRLHFGTAMECQYKLMTFGIPQHAFPFTEDGQYCLENHLQYIVGRKVSELHQKDIEMQKAKETEEANSNNNMEGSEMQKAKKAEEANNNNNKEDSKVKYISVPQLKDVLFGRGLNIMKHPGNVRFHHLIETYAEEYEASSKANKTDISHTLMQMVLDEKGRFLKWHESGWWEVASEKEARNKVSHAFRSRRAIIAQRENRDDTKSNNNNNNGKSKSVVNRRRKNATPLEETDNVTIESSPLSLAEEKESDENSFTVFDRIIHPVAENVEPSKQARFW